MKLTIATIATIALGVITATSANAGLFDSAATSGWDTKKSDKYKLEAYGFDLRVYEWTPKGNPDVTCITAFGEKGPVGLQCFETKLPKKDTKK